MLMVIPNEGKLKWLENAIPIEASISEPWWVRLYANDYTPVDGSTGVNFTEATFTGYAAVELLPELFSAPVLVGNVARADYPASPSYSCTGGSPQTVYGWFMVGQVSGIVYAAQRFDTPRLMATGSVEALDPFALDLKTFIVCP